MIQISQPFDCLIRPFKALVIYRSHNEESLYIEAYDMDEDGRPKNAHPLTEAESVGLAKGLASSKELNSKYLEPEGLLPENLLYLKSGMEGFAIWYTPPGWANLKFIDSLGIPSGMAQVPALIWKADRKGLSIFACKPGKGKSPNLNHPLYHAPFFNIYSNGRVCMGTVQVDIPEGCTLEDFITLWQGYFWTSYFSHCMQGHQPVAVNIVELWKDQIEIKKPFPEKTLLRTKLTLKDLLP